MTQIQLAHTAGVSYQTVRRIEAGKDCTTDTLVSIAGALEVDLAELFEVGDATGGQPEPLTEITTGRPSVGV